MIDRYRLINRHNPILKRFDSKSPFTVGNGDFAFTADITGLQTFPEIYSEIPLCTMAQWGWHSFVNNSYNRDDLELKKYQGINRDISYASKNKGQEELFNHLRCNPHKFHLGQIAFNIKKSSGEKIKINDIEKISQKLDIWQGTLLSYFEIQGFPVEVKTICHPYKDVLAVSVKSELIKNKQIFIDIKFPYASIDKSAADWDKKDEHKTKIIKKNDNSFLFLRLMDDDDYFVSFSPETKGEISSIDTHCYQYNPAAAGGEFSFTVEFAKETVRNNNLNFEEVEKTCRKYWSVFWNNGGIIDFSDSRDERAEELERRVVLSQYLTAVQCSGTYPPQETGLTCNSWYGKFHLEMHFWHAAHFAVWGREGLLEKSLWWYYSIMDKARELAKSQGYTGVRWPKMSDPGGNTSPSFINPFLIWQQPHPIMYAELLYRINPQSDILNSYKEIVFNTAEFMLSFVEYDDHTDSFILPPPLIPAQECHAPEDTINPTFELEYWHFALEIAQKWRKRMGLKKNKSYQEVIDKLVSLPVKDDVYLAHKNSPDTFSNKNYDHPSMLGAFGMLPGNKVDHKIMLNTLKRCINEWQFEKTWGWDFPMMAMTAARLGRAETAVDMLMMESPRNIFLNNGHNQQGKKEDLPLYLPGNGALLLAAGMMAAGWDGSGDKHAPGFPDNNLWVIKHEGINKYF